MRAPNNKLSGAPEWGGQQGNYSCYWGEVSSWLQQLPLYRGITAPTAVSVSFVSSIRETFIPFWTIA